MFVRKFADWIQFANGTKFSRTGSVRGWDGTDLSGSELKSAMNLTINPISEYHHILYYCLHSFHPPQHTAVLT